MGPEELDKFATKTNAEKIRDVKAKIERKEKLSLKLAERDLALCKQIKELSEKQSKVRTDRLKTMQGVSILQAELEQIVEKCFSMPNVEDELPQPSSVPNELWASKDWKAMETEQGKGEQLKKRMAQLAGVNVPEADTENNIHGGGGAASDGGPTPQPAYTLVPVDDKTGRHVVCNDIYNERPFESEKHEDEKRNVGGAP